MLLLLGIFYFYKMKPSELKEGDYNPYYKTYIDKIGDSDLQQTLEKQLKNFPNFMTSIPKEKLQYSYAEGKWTILETLQHIIDTERGFSYRAIVCLRNDSKTILYAMDEDFYAKNSTAKMVYFSSHGEKTLWDIKFEDDMFLVFGKESEGLPKDVIAKNKAFTYKIPLFSQQIRSLNLANAVGIVVYEGLRQLG